MDVWMDVWMYKWMDVEYLLDICVTDISMDVWVDIGWMFEQMWVDRYMTGCIVYFHS